MPSGFQRCYTTNRPSPPTTSWHGERRCHRCKIWMASARISQTIWHKSQRRCPNSFRFIRLIKSDPLTVRCHRIFRHHRGHNPVIHLPPPLPPTPTTIIQLLVLSLNTPFPLFSPLHPLILSVLLTAVTLGGLTKCKKMERQQLFQDQGWYYHVMQIRTSQSLNCYYRLTGIWN